MAAAPPAMMTPPPTANGAPPSPAQVNPTSPPMASPAPPVPSPRMQEGMNLTIEAVKALTAIAKAFPVTAGDIAEMNNKMREVTAKIMESAPTGEPAAPPA